MRRIALLGMGRSGTSFLTEFLGICGVYLDDVNWAHEHELARLVNDSILASEFGARAGLPYGKLPNEEIELSDYWHQMASFFVKYMDSRAQLRGPFAYWAFKDPRTTILHRIWLDHFDVIVGMFRAPQEVTASYIGKEWITGFRKETIALNYWKRFNRSLLHVYRTWGSKKPVYILDYNRNLESQTVLLCDKLQVVMTDKARTLFARDLNHYPNPHFPSDQEAVSIYRDLHAVSSVNQ